MSVTLGGYPVPMRQPVRWALTTGARPYLTEVTLQAADARELWKTCAGMVPTTLQMGDLSIGPVFLIGTGPSEFPGQITLTISDHRILWQGCWIFSGYNMRESTGNTRWMSGQGVVPFSAQANDIDYVLWSLIRGTTPWTIDSVYNDVTSRLRNYLAHEVNLAVTFDPFPGLGTVVQDLQIDAPADRAIEQVMTEASGYEIALDFQGKVHVIDCLDRSDIAAVQSGEPQVAMVGLPAVNDRRNQRPRSVRVLFDLEAELRFDSILETGAQTVARTASPAEAELEMVNVLPVVDPTATTAAGIEYTFGTYLSQADWIYAANQQTARAGAPALSLTVIRERWAGQRLMLTYAAPLPGIPADTDWERRVGAIYGHVRQTYKIVRQWKNRTRSWKPVRAAILDPENAARAPSQVYGDYAVVWGIAPNVKNLSDDSMMGVNVDGYAADINDAKPAESSISVIDQDQMIFHVSYDVGRWGGVKEIYPCHIDESTIPELRPASIGGKKFIAINQNKAMRLKESHRISVVFSCVPACGSLYQVEVTPGAAQAKVSGDIGPCVGPPIYVRVTPEKGTARFAWDDGSSDQIKALFGDGAQGSVATLSANVKHLLLDKEELDDVATGIAAQIYAAKVDQGQGEMTLPGIRTQIIPQGAIRIVTVQVGIDGNQTTHLSMPEQHVRRSLEQLLNPGTRQKLFRLVAR
jgi:hypothetical protein